MLTLPSISQNGRRLVDALHRRDVRVLPDGDVEHENVLPDGQVVVAREAVLDDGTVATRDCASTASEPVGPVEVVDARDRRRIDAGDVLLACRTTSPRSPRTPTTSAPGTVGERRIGAGSNGVKPSSETTT